jgi:hypothetical protein
MILLDQIRALPAGCHDLGATERVFGQPATLKALHKTEFAGSAWSISITFSIGRNSFCSRASSPAYQRRASPTPPASLQVFDTPVWGLQRAYGR